MQTLLLCAAWLTSHASRNESALVNWRLSSDKRNNLHCRLQYAVHRDSRRKLCICIYKCLEEYASCTLRLRVWNIVCASTAFPSWSFCAVFSGWMHFSWKTGWWWIMAMLQWLGVLSAAVQSTLPLPWRRKWVLFFKFVSPYGFQECCGRHLRCPDKKPTFPRLSYPYSFAILNF